MARLNEETFKAQLKREEFSNVYLLFGTESYLKDHYISRLKKRIVNPDFADFNLKEFEGRGLNIDDVIVAAQTLPMMSEYSLVIVYDFPFVNKGREKSTLNKDSFEKLKEYFNDISESCILVFKYDSIEVSTKNDSPWASVIKAFAKAGDAVEINERTPAELNRLVCSYAKNKGCTIGRRSADYLIECVGSGIQTIVNELDKLCAYVHGGEITNEIIDKIAVKSLQARVFDLSKYILRSDSDRAYKDLYTLFSQNESATDILPIIASYYVDMYRVKCAKEAGQRPDDIAEYYDYSKRKWIPNKAAGDSAKISVNRLREALDVLSEADMRMKTTGISAQHILEEAVAKLLVLGGRYD